ncbi:hypothetical protein PSP6_210342 [Paraburkholderia tropica]|nr:hypothetical protein PSP6_210342 [Paraburkholderia tropica]
MKDWRARGDEGRAGCAIAPGPECNAERKPERMPAARGGRDAALRSPWRDLPSTRYASPRTRANGCELKGGCGRFTP